MNDKLTPKTVQKNGLPNHQSYLDRQMEDMASGGEYIAENVLDAQRFTKSYLSKGIGARRVLKYLSHFRSIFKMLDKPLRLANRDDIEDLCVRIRQNEKWEPQTQRDYLIALRSFFKWCDNNEERFKLIKPPNLPSKEVDERHVLSPGEILAIANTTTDVREKAAVAMLYESAANASELCTMRVKDAWFENGQLYIHLPGTKNVHRNRIIPIHFSNPQALAWFKQYYEIHPTKVSLEAFLWLDKKGQRLNERELWVLLRALAERAGLGKIDSKNNKWTGRRVDARWFRHSKISALSKTEGFTELLVKRYAGHSPNSRMMSVYSHLGRDALLEAIKKTQVNLETSEEQVKKVNNAIRQVLLQEPDLVDLLIDRIEARGKSQLFIDGAQALKNAGYFQEPLTVNVQAIPIREFEEISNAPAGI